MKLYVFLTLVVIMHMSIAAAEFHKESVPACGRAFFFVSYDREIYYLWFDVIYKNMKNLDSQTVEQLMKEELDNSNELGETRSYFNTCVSHKYSKTAEGKLEKYAKCRLILPFELQGIMSKALAAKLPDTTVGLEETKQALAASPPDAKMGLETTDAGLWDNSENRMKTLNKYAKCLES